MNNDKETDLLRALKSLSFCSEVSRRFKITNELQALEAHAKQLYVDYLEVEQWTQVTLTIDTVSTNLQRAFMMDYATVRLGQPSQRFPTLPGTWWAWPPPPPVLHALDPSGHLKSVATPPPAYSPEDMEIFEEITESEHINDRI
jgi:hypothetical protein